MISMSTVRNVFWQSTTRGLGGRSWPSRYGLNGTIPAMVNRTDGSYSAGMSDAEGTRRWPSDSKNDRYVSRISSVLMPMRMQSTAACGLAPPRGAQNFCPSSGPKTSRIRGPAASASDRAPADDALAVHQARQLTGRGAVGRLVERQLERAVRPGGGLAEHPGGQRPRAVAELDAVDAGTVAPQPGAADAHAVGLERRARPDGDAAARGVLVQNEQRLAGVDGELAEPAALADREAVLPRVGAEHPSGGVDDLARLVADAAVAREEARAVGAGEEAEVLGIGLGGDRQPGRRGDLPHPWLRQLPKREAHPPQR